MNQATLTVDAVDAPVAASAPVKERFYRPELDLLRFGAFSLVFLSHWVPYRMDAPRAWLAIRPACADGVPVFFALSAFLITELLIRERRSTGTINLRSFYIRRILRIWPLYLLMLTLSFCAARLFGWAEFPTRTLVGNLLLLGNLCAANHLIIPLGVGVLWSIGVEEQFYLVWPTFAKRLNTHALLGLCGLVWLLSQSGTLWMSSHGTELWAIRFHTLTYIQYFAIGAALSLLLNGKRLSFPPAACFALFLLGVGVFYLATYICKVDTLLDPTPGPSTAVGYALVGLGTLIILLGALGLRVSPSNPGVYLGRISYGLYVYHLVALKLVSELTDHVLHMHSFRSPITLVLGLGITIPASMLSYRYFESPFLRLKKRFEIVKSREV